METSDCQQSKWSYTLHHLHMIYIKIKWESREKIKIYQKVLKTPFHCTLSGEKVIKTLEKNCLWCVGNHLQAIYVYMSLWLLGNHIADHVKNPIFIKKFLKHPFIALWVEKKSSRHLKKMFMVSWEPYPTPSPFMVLCRTIKVKVKNTKNAEKLNFHLVTTIGLRKSNISWSIFLFLDSIFCTFILNLWSCSWLPRNPTLLKFRRRSKEHERIN